MKVGDCRNPHRSIHPEDFSGGRALVIPDQLTAVFNPPFTQAVVLTGAIPATLSRWPSPSWQQRQLRPVGSSVVSVNHKLNRSLVQDGGCRGALLTSPETPNTYLLVINFCRWLDLMCRVSIASANTRQSPSTAGTLEDGGLHCFRRSWRILRAFRRLIKLSYFIPR